MDKVSNKIKVLIVIYSGNYVFYISYEDDNNVILNGNHRQITVEEHSHLITIDGYPKRYISDEWILSGFPHIEKKTSIKQQKLWSCEKKESKVTNIISMSNH